jgi:hypothetical protein
MSLTLAVLGVALLASDAFGRTIRVQVLQNEFDSQCDVVWSDGSVAARPGYGRTFDQSFSTAGPGPITMVIKNTGGKPVEFVGNWSINMACAVSVDGRMLGDPLRVSGYEPRNKTWSRMFAAPPPSGRGRPGAQWLPEQPVPQSRPQPPPQELLVSAQLQAAIVSDLTQVTPLANVTPLNNTSPFSMSTASTLIGNTGAALTTQSTGNLDLNRLLGRPPGPNDRAAVAKLRLIVQSYLEAFGRPPQSPELQYWASVPFSDPRISSGAALLANHGNWLRGNQPERTATIQRAFAAKLQRTPNAGEMSAWNGSVAQYGTLYKDIVSQLRVPALTGRITD